MPPSIMTLDQKSFLEAWKLAGEDTSPSVCDVAWRRYQHTRSPNYQTIPESKDPSLSDFSSALESLVTSPGVSPWISSFKFISIPSNTIPWLSTGIRVEAGTHISTFATGRIWRSRLLDYFLPPQFVLYFRIGLNGRILNSTHETNTFESSTDGELYLALQFPGAFGNPEGGRVQGPLSVYDPGQRDQGSIQVLIIVWREEITVPKITDSLRKTIHEGVEADRLGLLAGELNRLTSDYTLTIDLMSSGWEDFWFIGANAIFSAESSDDDHKAIRCRPDRNVGILQKSFDNPPVKFEEDTTVAWEWRIDALPSRLREDTRISHDYLSLAFEFENGRDLTYTWSWELPEGYGYWCPLAGWEDREFHVVIRTGDAKLGQWLDEKRNLWADYVEYINDSDDGVVVPKQIVRVWLIAGNRWQRHKGEMLIRKISIGDKTVL